MPGIIDYDAQSIDIGGVSVSHCSAVEAHRPSYMKLGESEAPSIGRCKSLIKELSQHHVGV